MIAAILVTTSSVSLTAELVEREYKNNCTKHIGGSVLVQKKQEIYTLIASTDYDSGKSIKNLSLFGDSFAISFETVNTNFSLISPQSILHSIADSDESVLFTCPDFELRERNYVTYEIDADTYEIMIKQSALRKTKEIAYF